MDLLVIGTSNCIGPNTFVSHLEKSGVKVTNYSIGASSSNCGLFSTFGLEDIRSDFALIDLSINDREFWRFRKKDFEDITANIKAMVHRFRQSGCIPIIAILPQCAKATLDENSPVAELYKDIAKNEKVTFVDIARLFGNAYRAGVDPNLLMRDPYHISPRLTPLVSQIFLEAMSILRTKAAHTIEHSCEIRQIKAIRATDLSISFEVINRQTSHRSANYIVLRNGEYIDIPVGVDQEVMGVLLNTGAPGSKVRFDTSNGSVTKSFIVFFDRQNPDSFKTIMVDFKPHLRSDAGSVRMSLVDIGEQITDSTLYEQSPIPGRYGQIEIEGFLIGGREFALATSDADVWHDLDLDILLSLDEGGYLDSIVGLCRQ